MKLHTLRAEGLELLTQSNRRGVSIGDLVAMPSGKVGVIQRIDKRTRTVRAQVIASTRAGVDKAVNAFRDFSGHEPSTIVIADTPKVGGPLWMLGELEGVIYNAVRDGRRERYLHKFRKDRPALAVSFDGQQLVILGGGYQVTDRGIEG